MLPLRILFAWSYRGDGPGVATVDGGAGVAPAAPGVAPGEVVGAGDGPVPEAGDGPGEAVGESPVCTINVPFISTG